MTGRAEQEWLRIASELAGNLESTQWHKLASSQQAQVFYNVDENIYLKLFYESRWRNKLKAGLLPALSRHRSFVRNCQRLTKRGFIAPRVIAYGKALDAGYVVTEGFNGMGLGSFASQYLVRSVSDPRIRRWKRQVMVALGAELAQLHNAGISHGDLRPDNILLSCVSPTPRFCFIDNERNRLHLFATPQRARVKNLSQLNMIWSEDLSASYRLRFIKSYLADCERPMNAKALISKIQGITQRRLEGKRRGGYLNTDNRQMCRPNFDRLLADS